MNKKKFLLVYSLLFIYTLFYKLVFVSYNEQYQYLINPLVWITLTILCYYLLYYKHKGYFPFRESIIYRVIISSLLYIILFYTLGIIVNFSNNPYSLTTSGIIVNFFSILLIIALKEIIRSILVNIPNANNRWYLFLIFILFMIMELDIMAVIKIQLTLESFFTFILNDLLTNIVSTLFCIYLVKNGGYLPSLLYRVIIFLPILIIPIVPKYDWLIPALFNILFPIFTFVIIEHMLNRKDRFLPFSDRNIFQPKRWLLTLFIITLVITFSLGGFGVKPIVIITGSMKPYINEGDLLLIKKCSINDVSIGEVIQFQVSNYTVVHRVIRIYNDHNDIKIITKGDNNNSEDRYPINSQNLLGCLKYKIPYLGYPSYLVGSMFNND